MGLPRREVPELHCRPVLWGRGSESAPPNRVQKTGQQQLTGNSVCQLCSCRVELTKLLFVRRREKVERLRVWPMSGRHAGLEAARRVMAGPTCAVESKSFHVRVPAAPVVCCRRMVCRPFGPPGVATGTPGLRTGPGLALSFGLPPPTPGLPLSHSRTGPLPPPSFTGRAGRFCTFTTPLPFCAMAPCCRCGPPGALPGARFAISAMLIFVFSSAFVTLWSRAAPITPREGFDRW